MKHPKGLFESKNELRNLEKATFVLTETAIVGAVGLAAFNALK